MVRMNKSSSEWERITTRVLQGSALGIIKNNLHNSFDIIIHWFYKNYMMLHARKYHFMYLGNDTENKTFYSIIILWKIAINKKFLDL